MNIVRLRKRNFTGRMQYRKDHPSEKFPEVGDAVHRGGHPHDFRRARRAVLRMKCIHGVTAPQECQECLWQDFINGTRWMIRHYLRHPSHE